MKSVVPHRLTLNPQVNDMKKLILAVVLGLAALSVNAADEAAPPAATDTNPFAAFFPQFNATAAPAAGELKFGQPADFLMYMDPATYALFMQPATYTQFVKPETYTQFMNPNFYMAFMNPASYTVFMDPNTYLKAMVKGMNPASYAVFWNPATYAAMMDPKAYQEWIDLVTSYTGTQS